MDRRTPGQKTRDKLTKKDPLHYSKIGAAGGKAEVPTKGFGSWPKEKLIQLSYENARKRRERKRV